MTLRSPAKKMIKDGGITQAVVKKLSSNQAVMEKLLNFWGPAGQLLDWRKATNRFKGPPETEPILATPLLASHHYNQLLSSQPVTSFGEGTRIQGG